MRDCTKTLDRSFSDSISLCKDNNLTPLFSRKDWIGFREVRKGPRKKYTVRCNRCGNTYDALFDSGKVKPCPFCKLGVVVRSYDSATKICREHGVELLCPFDSWNGTQRIVNGQRVYIEYKVRCLKCGNEYNTTFAGWEVRVCPCSRVREQWRSRREQEITSWLNSLGLEVQNNVRIVKGLSGRQMEYDIYLPKYSVAIELNGQYFHSVSGDYAKYERYHADKTDYSLKEGIKLYHFWEYSPVDVVKSVILSKLGLLSRVIYARKCEITYKNLSGFFAQNHLDGECLSSYRVGLEYKGEVVAVMSLRYNNGYAEIARFATKIGVSVVGGVSKLLKNCISEVKSKGYAEIVSFCNRDICPNLTDSVYFKLGFEYEGSHLSYWYWASKNIGRFVHKERYSRQKCMKSDLIKDCESLGIEVSDYDTEKSIAERLGLYRCYNSGNYKFVKRLR